MVEEELRSNFDSIIEGGYGLFPLGKVIDGDNDILMAKIYRRGSL